MWKNYLLTTLRSVQRQRGYAAINLVGLAVGLACFLLAFLYLQHAYSFDTYHENGDRIYRVLSFQGFGEKEWHSYVSGDPIEELRVRDTDVADATKYQGCGSSLIQRGADVFSDVKMLCAESSLFNLFSFDLLSGDPATVLDRPNTLVITQSLAQRLFGNGDPIGRTLPIRGFGDDAVEMEVTGLMADVPTNTHFTFDLLVSYVSLEATNRCLTCGQPMYVLLEEGGDPEAVAARTLTYLRDVQEEKYVEHIRLEPLADVHFSEVYAARQGDRRYVYLLSAIALVILLIACANYTNLATARALRRSREIGVRKALGAGRGQIARQFFAETVLMTLLALPVAWLLLVLALPVFNTLADVEIALNWRDNLPLLGVLVSAVVLVGVVAGSYPSLFLARFQPVTVLRGQTDRGMRGGALRKALVVFQFAATILLISGTAIILRQLDYVQAKNLGFETESVLVVHLRGPDAVAQGESLRQAMLRVPGVSHAALGFGMPGQRQFSGMMFVDYPFGRDQPAVEVVTPPVSPEFLETFDVPLLAGRNIRAEVTPGAPEALVNEAAVAAMRWASPEEALGETIGHYRVVGVVPDFHAASLHRTIGPMALTQKAWGEFGTLALRLAPGDVRDALDGIRRTWDEAALSVPFDYAFLRDEIDTLYERERRTATIFATFAGLAVLIACLGLVGLAAFTTARRTKEIGIRKVLGASTTGVVALLARDYVVLVGVAFVLAVPVAYVAAQRWLDAFAYRTTLAFDVFFGAGALALSVALVAVGVQAWRAAQANPADALRCE